MCRVHDSATRCLQWISRLWGEICRALPGIAWLGYTATWLATSMLALGHVARWLVMVGAGSLQWFSTGVVKGLEWVEKRLRVAPGWAGAHGAPRPRAKSAPRAPRPSPGSWRLGHPDPPSLVRLGDRRPETWRTHSAYRRLDLADKPGKLPGRATRQVAVTVGCALCEVCACSD